VRQPAYQRIADDLRARIRSGDLTPGARVPSRKQLAEQYQVADSVPLQAVRLLIAEGLVVTRPGAGSFVREPGGVRRMQRGWEDVEPPDGATRVTETVTARVASPAEADALGMHQGGVVLVVTREAWAGKEQVSFSTQLLSAEGTELAYEVPPPQP
jgi:DNA-binding GntR family transcriptional regulator